MPRDYKSFNELRDSVSDTYSSMAQLLEKFDWGFFSEDGCNKIEVYSTLNDNFLDADDKTELVKIVAGEIDEREKSIKHLREKGASHFLKEIKEKNEVIKYLAKYIRHNCERELWADYPEFDYNHSTYGSFSPTT
ncbi:MAG: hypothetical protein ACI4PO_09305 [Faecousia sp.]